MTAINSPLGPIPVEVAGSSAAAAIACAHCGLDVPRRLIEPHDGPQFCCHGCRAVYAVIHECGLENYYRVRAIDEAAPQAARTTGRRYEEYDDALFEELHVRTRADGLKFIELFLEGVHCNACVWLVEKLPQLSPQVREARLDLRRALLHVAWEPAAGNLSAAARVLDSLGYPPHPARDAVTRDLRRQEDHKLLIRIAVAGAAAGNAMLLGFALYSGAAGDRNGQFAGLFRWLSMAIGVIALAWPGSLFFRGAWAALRTRTAHLDLPIAIGLLAGGVAGTINTLTGRGEIYFDSLCVLVFALLVGRWIQRRQQRWAADAVELLYSLTPSAARRIEADTTSASQAGVGEDARHDAGAVVAADERIREVPIEAIRTGDLLEVRAGDTIPVDGRVAGGWSNINEALLTGEARPREARAGERVFAGTLNLTAALRVRAESTGAQTRVGKLLALVEAAGRQPARFVRLADRVAGFFTVGMLALAALTFALWQWRGSPQAIDHAVALLIVTCPCALGLATPLILTMAIARGAKRRVLVKGGQSLEQLTRPGLLFLDKTGTLTQGRMVLVGWHEHAPAGEAQADSMKVAAGCASPAVVPGALDARTLRALVVAVERHSAHPVARALCDALTETNAVGTRAVALEAENVEQIAAGGIRARVDGRRVLIGSRTLLESCGIATQLFSEVIEAAAARGHTPVLVSIDGRVAALAEIGDPLRPDARMALESLRAQGWSIGILSGDEPRVVQSVAAALGLDPKACRGGVTPEGKLSAIETARATAQGRSVVMVGDGVNDSAALAAAHVGIAVHGGAEASLAAAHVYLDRPGLAPIVELLRAGRRTVGLIRVALGVSLCYNLTTAALAIAGRMDPLIAAILMPVSSLAVLMIALLGRTFDPGRLAANAAERAGA